MKIRRVLIATYKGEIIPNMMKECYEIYFHAILFEK
jgi:hypothetical protein